MKRLIFYVQLTTFMSFSEIFSGVLYVKYKKGYQKMSTHIHIVYKVLNLV